MRHVNFTIFSYLGLGKFILFFTFLNLKLSLKYVALLIITCIGVSCEMVYSSWNFHVKCISYSVPIELFKVRTLQVITVTSYYMFPTNCINTHTHTHTHTHIYIYIYIYCLVWFISLPVYQIPCMVL